MKTFKILTFVIAGLLIIFFAIGLLTPSFMYESRVEIDAPQEESFAVFTNLDLMGHWLTGFKSIKPITLSANHIGSAYKLVIENEGETFEMTQNVTGFKPNELYAFNLDNDILRADVEIRFFGDSTRTLIEADTIVRGSSIIWRSMLPLFKSHLKEQAQNDYDKLKQLVEQRVTELPPERGQEYTDSSL